MLCCQVSIIATLAIASLTFSGCATVPAVYGIDEETQTILVDQEAVSQEVKDWLEAQGIKIEEINAKSLAVDEKIDAIAAGLQGVNQAVTPMIPGLSTDLVSYIILLLIGGAGAKKGGGLLRNVLRGLLGNGVSKK